MGKKPAIKIQSSAFKFIASLDLFAVSFIKDEDLFPSDAPPPNRQVMYDEFAADLPYCPAFAISAGDVKPRRFDYKGKFIEFTPGPNGLPTIRDFDVLIYCVTWIANAALEGRDADVGAIYEFEVDDFYAFAGRPRNGDRENLFVQGLERLAGGNILTNTRPIGLDNQSFHFIETYQQDRDEAGRLKTVRITLPHTVYCLAHNEFFDPIHADYFALSAVRRLIYLFIKQFCGGENALLVPFTKLHSVTGSTSPLRKFLPVIDELVAKPLPEFSSIKNEGAENISVTCIA
jgi:hypothetical protein